MNETQAAVWLLLGFVLRLGIPIGLTLLLGWGLRKLDTRWKQQALDVQAQRNTAWQVLPGARCWQVRGCTSDQRIHCAAYLDPVRDCWEIFRQNGSLRRSCQECEFRLATTAFAAAD